METTVEKLIAERSYASLNAEEKASIADLCASEHEFNQMKQFFAGIGSVAEASYYEPSASLKSSLDSVFAAKHGGIGANLTPREPISVPQAAKIVPMYQQTWFKSAAAVVLLAGVFTIWKVASPDDLKMNADQQLAKAERSDLKETATPVTAPIDRENIAVTKNDASETGQKEKSQIKSTPVNKILVPDGPFRTYRTIPAPSFSSDRLEGDTYSAASGYADSTSFVTGDAVMSFTTAKGMNADLYPGGFPESRNYNGSGTAILSASVADSDENLLSMIVPAF